MRSLLLLAAGTSGARRGAVGGCGFVLPLCPMLAAGVSLGRPRERAGAHAYNRWMTGSKHVVLLNTGGTGWPEHSSNIRKSTLDPGFSSHVTPKVAVCSKVDFICIQNTDVTTGKCLPKSDSEIQSAVGKARNAIQSNALQLKARQQAEDKVCVFCK